MIIVYWRHRILSPYGLGYEGGLSGSDCVWYVPGTVLS
jgi:hypothetical protein